MANSFFAFKQFTVYHDKCAMKVGTDGVLLGAWVSVPDTGRILDVGTGTGLIAMMMAQRSGALIDAVEIEEKACIQAEENVEACPWKNSIKIHHTSFQQYAYVTRDRYDVIVCNPPFFHNSLKSPTKSRSLARHNESLSYEGLLISTAQLLKPDGWLAIIVPANEIANLSGMAYSYQLYPSKLLMIRPFPGKDHTRCLAEYSRKIDQPIIKNELIIKQNDLKKYTEDYKALTQAYYLKIQ